MRGERGSALLLVPAGALIMVLLGALMVDSAAAYLAEREVEATAAALANDLATLAIDETALRATGVYVIAARRVEALTPTIEATAAEQLSSVLETGSVAVNVRVLGFDAVEVSVSGRGRRLIGGFDWTGVPRTYAVEATAVGKAHVSG